MLLTRVRTGETLNMLSARLRRPACMIMRANRILSPAWLLPGREIAVPPRDFCLRDAGACPCAAFKRPAGEAAMRRFVVRAGQSIGDLAREAGLPERIVLLTCGIRAGEPLSAESAVELPVPPERARIITVQPGDTQESICRQYGMERARFSEVNVTCAPLLPGMRVIVWRKGGGVGW